MNEMNDINGASRRVMLGMSGGVDSCAAALLLKEQGCEVCGVTMLLCPDSSESDESVADARAVCRALDIEHRTLDLRGRFADTVIADFVAEYGRARTPNPCVTCNREIKFGAMLDYALECGFDRVATGHYARIVTDSLGRSRVRKDTTPKDQSYVLWRLDADRLSRIVLPVNGYAKDDLRAMVRAAGLPVHSKPDSQDICFIPDGDYVAFLERYAGTAPREGNFVDADGRVIGRHGGVVRYTVGQRKGLGGCFGEPMYVTRLNAEKNEITLGREGSQYARRMICGQINLHGGAEETANGVQVKARYSARPAQARITLDLSAGMAEVVFDEPQRALTPGQSAVFYDGDLLLGGGIIDEVIG